MQTGEHFIHECLNIQPGPSNVSYVVSRSSCSSFISVKEDLQSVQNFSEDLVTTHLLRFSFSRTAPLVALQDDLTVPLF